MGAHLGMSVLQGMLLFAVAFATENDFYKVDLSPLSQSERNAMGEKEAALLKRTRTKRAEIAAWHERAEEKLEKYQERKEKEFARAVRKAHCNKLKRNLIKKASATLMTAKKISKARKQKALEKKATERAQEVLSKVSERDEARAARLLGDTKVATNVNPKDAKFWLKAFQRADPTWQRDVDHHLHKLQRTNPDWRKHQNNAENDGAYSWSRQTRMGTSYDQHPEMQLTQPLYGESVTLLQESTAATQRKAFDTSGTSPNEDEGRELRRKAELKEWFKSEEQKNMKYKDALGQQIDKMEQKETKAIKKLQAKKNHASFCSKERNMMHRHLADVVLELPVPDAEKTTYETPLLKDMETWLKCESCKKRKKES